ncbi:hypothetical protein SAMN04487969_101265 [Paenibacillus algorifonticola]|uniref:Helicase XPB/Ssl2 N-terminal domain-containing protein n=1 Tax=Paenibacillus algorifonticola TaxID=684063 RepID=A0A1I1Y342_9BACL|nr:helicase-associated domain-containing protein [Paenibacillus algorifonticola]SFE13971.1 hypothetical protein SAMN04487969_101265 [Paenibacillus algorifonticola]
MYVHELADKLTDYRQQTFMEAPMWWYAVKEDRLWSDAVKDRRSVLEAIQSLSSTTLETLKAVMKLAGADPASEERLFRLGPKLARMSGAEFRWALTELQRGGLVFSVSRNWGERVYFVPRDSFALWQQLLFPCHLDGKAMDTLAETEDEVQFHASGRLLGLQLLDAWTELARSGLALTNKGILPKKIIARIGIAVTFTEQHIACLNISDDRVRKYGRKAAFILETAIRLGLLEEEEDRLVWVKDKLEQWLLLNSLAREACLHSLMVEHYLYRQPLLAHGAAALSVLSTGHWYEARDWLHHAQSDAVAVAAGQLDLGDKLLLLGWLDTLHAFGWIERMELSADRSWFHWMINPQQGPDDWAAPLPNEAVIVQPNGEIIVLPECDGRIRWELELMAERVNEEQLGLYRLSRKSIERAIAFGRTEAAMLAFLGWASGSQDAAAEAAPLLRDWASKLGQLSKPVPSGGSIGEGRDYPSFHDSSQQSLAAGFRLYPVYGMAASRAEQEEWLGHYELIQHDEEHNQGSYAGLKQIPASWLNQRRAYHHSTSREMMERALQWQTPVELLLEEGMVSFVPWELHAESNSWSVSGSFSGARYGEIVRLSPGSWQAMRLLVPGINFHT